MQARARGCCQHSVRKMELVVYCEEGAPRFFVVALVEREMCRERRDVELDMAETNGCSCDLRRVVASR
jgi:hypothetical protein